MEPGRIRIFRYDVDSSYARRYNELFYAIHADKIRGEVLDLGSKRDNESHYSTLSDRIERYTAVDMDPLESVDVIADGRCLPFDSNRFDTVILSEVLEHVPMEDLVPFLREVNRITSPTGHLLGNVPFVYPVHGERDFHRPTYHGLKHVFDSSGFTYEVFLGGTYVDVVLHVLQKPLRRISVRLPTNILLHLFSVVHYVATLASILLAAAFKFILGRNPISENWYVTQFVVAKPVGE